LSEFEMISSSVSGQFRSVAISMLMVMIGLCASQDSQIACRDKQRLLGTGKTNTRKTIYEQKFSVSDQS
jgi:hypothetical protein